MATCSDFKITLVNGTSDELKAKKFEYLDGSNWKTENMFGVDGFQKLMPGKSVTFTRDLGGIGNESTKFRVTYSCHIGGSKWGDDQLEVTSSFVAQDNNAKTVTLA